MPILPSADWPKCLISPLVLPYIHHLAGIFTGGCVKRGDGSRFRAVAHAHVNGDYNGWICVLAARRLECDALVLHEFAHLVTTCGHTDRWRRLLLSIGGTLDSVPDTMRSYHKRPRRKRTVYE